MFSLTTPSTPLDFENTLPKSGSVQLSYLEDLISVTSYERGLCVYNIDTKRVNTLNSDTSYVCTCNMHS